MGPAVGGGLQEVCEKNTQALYSNLVLDPIMHMDCV